MSTALNQSFGVRSLLCLTVVAVLTPACGESKFSSSKPVAAVEAKDSLDQELQKVPDDALGCSLSSSALKVKSGTSIKVTYQTEGAVKSVKVDGQSDLALDQGSFDVVVTEAKSIKMTVAGSQGNADCGLDIALDDDEVSNPSDPSPTIATSLCHLSVFPDNAAAGTPVAVILAVDGPIAAASINGIPVDPRGGSSAFTPQVSTAYSAWVTGPQGSGSCSAGFTVTGTAAPVLVPSCRLEASAYEINSGEAVSVTLATADTVTALTLDGETVSNGGSKIFRPVASQNIAGSVTGVGGQGLCSININVRDAVPPAPPTCTLAANPAMITTGGTSTLHFTWTGLVTSASFGGHVAIASGYDEIVSPSTSQTYTGMVTGPGGTTTCDASVAVGASPVPPAPSCTLSPAAQTIVAGASAALTLSWSGDVSSALLDGSPINASGGSKSVTPSATKIYSASVTGPGGTRSCASTVTVTPPPASSFLLSVAKGGLGTGTVLSGVAPTATINCGSDCSEVFAANTAVTLQAAPFAGSAFDHWGGACSGTSPSCNLTVTAATSVVVYFKSVTVVPQYALNVAKSGAGSGAVTATGISCGSDCSETFADSSLVTLAAAPDANSSFVSWTGCDSVNGTICIVTIHSSRSVTANFSATCIPGIKYNLLTFEGLAEEQVIGTAQNNTFAADYGIRLNYGNVGESFKVARVSRRNQTDPNFMAWGAGACPGAPAHNRLCDSADEVRAGDRALSSSDSRGTKDINFTIDYSTPVKELSFDLLDVDGSEAWSIELYNASGTKLSVGTNIVTTYRNGPAPSGNGDIGLFEIKRPSADIKSVKIHGTKNNVLFGFGFDNFRTGVPVCAAL